MHKVACLYTSWQHAAEESTVHLLCPNIPFQSEHASSILPTSPESLVSVG